MLKEILIKNFILIDELKLEFNSGFNVFLGETGAGKSMSRRLIPALCIHLSDSLHHLKQPCPARYAISLQ